MSRRARPPDPAQIFWPSTADYVNGNHHIYATPSTCQPSDDAIRINGSGGYASTPTFASVYAVPATSNGYQSDYSVDTAESESLIHYENNLERHKGKKRRLIIVGLKWKRALKVVMMRFEWSSLRPDQTAISISKARTVV
ncbi:hypothetical protein M3Y96_00185600 [Aphelenchoides besseyi]|nr:hypothetical protein M3Y96_00185600 [Aphelenchoides besseyi]